MRITTNDHSIQLGGNIGWILVILLVAGSSFLIGSSFRQKQSLSGPAALSTATSQPSAIADISNALQANPPVTDQATTVSADVTRVAPKVTGLVNINTGTAVELETLPGIGPSKAKAIIDYRAANGPFVRIEEIEKVKGIGPKTFASFKSKITI